jgi:hypothetical protein
LALHHGRRRVREHTFLRAPLRLTVASKVIWLLLVSSFFHWLPEKRIRLPVFIAGTTAEEVPSESDAYTDKFVSIE